MAGPYYVRSTDGNNADSGLTWALAKATLAGALAVAAAGERIWVSQVHAETQASAMTLTSPGTAASPVEILCGNDAAEPPTALATTGKVDTTGANAITFATGVAVVDGLTFTAGSGASAAYIYHSGAEGIWQFRNCGLALGNTNGGSLLYLGTSGPLGTIQLDNVTLTFGHASQQIWCFRDFVMRGGAVTGTAPSALIYMVNVTKTTARFIGVDLSAITGSLVLQGVAAHGSVVFEQCKLGAGVALTSGTVPDDPATRVWLDNCDSADTQYRMQRHEYAGSVYSDTAVFRTSGASDGITPLSHKMVSSANARFLWPLYGPEIVIYNAAVGSSKTVTVEIVRDIAATNLNDNEVWLEAEYLGTTGFPLSLFTKDRMTDILSTPAAQDASSVGWTLGGFGTAGTKQKLVVTFTPQEVGIIRCRVALAKASTTLYVDPLLTVA